MPHRYVALQNAGSHTYNHFIPKAYLPTYFRITVTSKKSPNVNKSDTKMISLEKRNIYKTLQQFPKNGGNLDKIIVATGDEKLPKVQ